MLRSSRRKVDELAPAGGRDLGESGLVVELARRVLERLAATLPTSTELVLSHGDFSPRNVLLTPDGLALIDFDRLQLAAPERDISYWGAWTWVTMLTTGQQPRWRVGDELALAYNRFRPRPRIRSVGVGVLPGRGPAADRPRLVRVASGAADRGAGVG